MADPTAAPPTPAQDAAQDDAPAAAPATATQAPPAVLAAHRTRVATLQAELQRLGALHDELYDLWARIVRKTEEQRQQPSAQGREELDALHDEAYALGTRIAEERERAFGAVAAEARLALTAKVESVPADAFSAVRGNL